ncbi:hypothetical protein [Mycobacterium botniense]|nr:hypothetical protein [Mycobacterium botniense]
MSTGHGQVAAAWAAAHKLRASHHRGDADRDAAGLDAWTLYHLDCGMP